MCRFWFLVFCPESLWLQFKSSAWSEWYSHFPFHRFHCCCLHSFVVFLLLSSAEKIRSHTPFYIHGYGTAKRLNDFILYMNDLSGTTKKPRASFFSSSNHLPLCYYWICWIDLIYFVFVFQFSFASSFIVHFSQICGFRMFSAVDRRQFKYIFFLILYLQNCKIV